MEQKIVLSLGATEQGQGKASGVRMGPAEGRQGAGSQAARSLQNSQGDC